MATRQRELLDLSGGHVHAPQLVRVLTSVPEAPVHPERRVVRVCHRCERVEVGELHVNLGRALPL